MIGRPRRPEVRALITAAPVWGAAAVAAVAAVCVIASLIGADSARAARSPRLVSAASTAASTPIEPPSLAVTGACLMVAGTDQILFAQGGEDELPIASTTKLMTALVTLQHVQNLSTVFTQNDWYPGPGDSQIGLIPGERMSVHDLLLALLLPSADDAAEDLADNVGGGSVARFVAMMNADAQALGLAHTHYTTPIGLDTPGNYSSPCDLDRLAAEDLSFSAYFRRVVALPAAVLESGRYRRTVTNTDDLVGRVPWIHGVKTGHTAAAGYVLVSEGERDGMTLIGSVLGTASEAARDANALALLDYGFASDHVVAPVIAGQVLARPAQEGVSGRARVIAAGSFSTVTARSAAVSVAVQVPARLAGPLRRDAVVGHATVLVGGREVARIPLELAAAVPAPSRLSRVATFLIRPSTLTVLALVLGTVSAFAGTRRRVSRGAHAGRLE